MARVAPFRALRPKPGLAEKVASVPYDVVSRDEARVLARGNPLSYLHVTRPEIDLADDVDAHSDDVYRHGRSALDRFVADGTLIRDDTESLYVYELTMGEHVQRGVVLLASVADYDRNIVRKHEYTRPDKEDDRVRHMELLGAQSGTVFLTHRDDPAIDGPVEACVDGTPDADFVAPDGVRHRVWTLDASATAAVVAGFDAAGPIYIADGHHRSAAASRVAASRNHSDGGFLAVSFPASQMNILPYNRYVHDLNGHSVQAFLDAIAKGHEVSAARADAPELGEFSMYVDGRWFRVRVPSAAREQAGPVARLDVSLLQDRILKPLLGIEDPRTSETISFIGGIRGEGELVKRVDAGGGVSIEGAFYEVDGDLAGEEVLLWWGL
ncbi:MAG: DUF1015 domain-containing protein, partial [Myxococcota bacterium]